MAEAMTTTMACAHGDDDDFAELGVAIGAHCI